MPTRPGLTITIKTNSPGNRAKEKTNMVAYFTCPCGKDFQIVHHNASCSVEEQDFLKLVPQLEEHNKKTGCNCPTHFSAWRSPYMEVSPKRIFRP